MKTLKPNKQKLGGQIAPLRRFLTLATLTFVSLTLIPKTHAQKVESKDRDRGQTMLMHIKDELKKHYYDPNFRGMDLDARFATASAKIKDAASVGQILGIIAQVLLELDDSHTFFLPPQHQTKVDYGWTMQMIGDHCFVNAVDKGSDAEAKGVKIGDEVIEAGGYKLSRDNLWKFDYLYNTLRPQPLIRATLRSPGGEPRQLELVAKQTTAKKIIDLTNYNEIQDLVRSCLTFNGSGFSKLKSQYHLAVAGGSVQRLQTRDVTLAHPLPRGGTDLNSRESGVLEDSGEVVLRENLRK